MRTSGSGVVSNVPSRLRIAMMIAPVSCRTRISRIVLPACVLSCQGPRSLPCAGRGLSPSSRRRGTRSRAASARDSPSCVRPSRTAARRGRRRRASASSPRPRRMRARRSGCRVAQSAPRARCRDCPRRSPRPRRVPSPARCRRGADPRPRSRCPRSAGRRCSLAALTASSWKSSTTYGSPDSRNSSATRRPTRP